MARTKFIKDRNGKFAGSIGAGREDTPRQAAKTVIPPLPRPARTLAALAERVDAIYARFLASRNR